MANLFYIFDPVTHFQTLRLNWSAVLVVLAFPSLFWVTFSKPSLFIREVLIRLKGELSSVLFKGVPNSIIFTLLSLLLFIFINNFFGLLPYVFTATSHISVTLSLAFPLWSGYILYNFAKNTRRALAHLVPKGTPYVLVPFMVLIEIVRNLMRPLTLSIRLAANMVAGHLLLALVRGPMPSISIVLLGAAFVALVALIVLELGVSFIQAYVFMTLSSLYLDEINNLNN